MSAHQIEITILSGVSTGDKFRFNVSGEQSIVVGRSPECDLVLQDATVSRKHAELFLGHDGIYLGDLGSSRGTVHMGFQLSIGKENGRKTSDYDEFKIGEAIFRINYDESKFATKTVKTPGEAGVSGPGIVETIKEKFSALDKKHKMLAGLVLVAGIAYFALGEEKKAGIPAQRSHISVNIPLVGLVGYWNAGKGYKDLSRADKVIFNLPSSDVLVEYDYRSEAPVEILLDGALIEKIEAEPDIWVHRSLIIRDILTGSDRKLVFDSLGYNRRGKNKPGSKPKRWAIRDIRMTPISRGLNDDLRKSILASKGAMEASDKSADGLYSALTDLRKSVFEQVLELKLDGVGFASSLESLFPDAIEFGITFDQMLDERESLELNNELMMRHLEVLTTLTARVDAELWRRVNSRIKSAEKNAQVRKYINSYDDLMAAKAMFPDDTDLRWHLAENKFNNNKIVPRKVRRQPHKYRKRAR